jgi:thiol:disulfide interchange protein DsbC
MKIFRFKKSLTLCLLFFLISGVAAFAAAKKSTPEEALKKIFPKLRYNKITKTNIDGLYEVMADGKIVYFYPKTGNLIIGEIIDKEGRSLTRERLAEEKYKLLTPDDLKNAVKVGNGKNVVIEVTDPDCPYCRKMHTYWSMRSDVTRYIFFKPLDMHPDAAKKVKYILSSPDRLKALFEIYCGKYDNNREVLDKAYDDKGLAAAQKSVADKLQVNGTPAFWVNGKFVSGANIPLIESMIGKLAKSGSGSGLSTESHCAESK